MSKGEMSLKKKKKIEMKFVEERQSLREKDEFWVKMGENEKKWGTI